MPAMPANARECPRASKAADHGGRTWCATVRPCTWAAHAITDVVFDKTGTLTTGLPDVATVVYLQSIFETDERVWHMVGAAEKSSEHPLAASIVKYATEVRAMLGLGLVKAPTDTCARAVPGAPPSSPFAGAHPAAGRRLAVFVRHGGVSGHRRAGDRVHG